MQSRNASGFLRAQVAHTFRGRLSAGAATAAAIVALSIAPGMASAQEAGEEAEDAAAIIVTGSRIMRNGNDAPTPVSVISTEEIQAEAPANIADFVNTLPSVSGSQTAVSNSGSLSNGQTGISALNLRSLGQNRTLVLLDGKRSVASTSTGLVDINTFPQALIERVEVVTGGASSVYGSDAVAGVVNFVLDRDYVGLKADYEYGVTTYGDIPNHKASITGGAEFSGGRGHIVASFEYFTQEGVHSIDRDWNDTGYFQIDNPGYTATNGQPARLVLSGVGSSNFAPGGLITAGPLRGTYFGAINPATGRATTGNVNYGTVSGQWMVGGDYRMLSEGHASSNSLANDEDRMSFFGRASYELSDAITVFGQASYSKFEGYSIYQQTPSVGVVIQRDNAFLPENIRQEMIARNLTSITMGTSNAGITGGGGDTGRQVQRYLAGAEGDFGIGSMDWSWDAYYQFGKTKSRETLTDTWQNARMSAMQDAVFDGSGRIVCRVNTDASSANDLPGCVPINRIGVGGITQEARDFLFAIGPEREQFIKQQVAGVNFATPELFEGWAGPISLAFGGEWRKESVDGYVDPINFNTTWLYGNFKVTTGSYTVKEAYAETLIPLFEGAEFNGALRVTDYSISGQVETWKMGLTYQPIYDIKLRGTWSRDIRAPNLNELFDPGTARTNSVNVPNGSGGIRAEEFIQNLTGSLDLTPEIAETYGVGMVFTPEIAPGFAFAVDYFNIKIDDAIGSVTAQTTANLCFEQNIQEFCGDIVYAAGSSTDITYINLAPFNFASQKASGLDVEASYSLPVGPGTLSVRALGTYYIENVSDNGIDAPNDSAGVNAGGGIPSFTYRATLNYAMDNGLNLGLVARGFSDGVYDNDYIECSTGCPATDPVFRTINTNKIQGTTYVDTNISYDFEAGPLETTAFLSVRNVFNTDPVLIGNGPDGNNTPAYPQTNRSLYDTFGRTFRMGVRIKY